MSKENPRKELSLGSKYNRYFSESFKREKVKLVLKNQLSVTQLSRLYGVSRASVYKWIYKYSDLERGQKMVVQMESEEFKTKRLQEKVAELERAIGQKQLEIDFLNKTLEFASKEVGYDLKKKYNSK